MRGATLLRELVSHTWLVVLVGLMGSAGAVSADTPIKSGYALGPAQCGSGALSFPRIKIDMKPGFCAGLVASGGDGLKFPRAIAQIPGRPQFVMADVVGWGHGDGRLLLLDPTVTEGSHIRELVTGLDYPFGLVVSPDGKLYASTDTTIFRFDPLADHPQDTIETIVHDLPGRRLTLPDGT